MWQRLIPFFGLLAFLAHSGYADHGRAVSIPPLKVSIYSGATEYKSDQTLADFKT